MSKLIIKGKELNISDGFNTMESLYIQRMLLFILLMQNKRDISWKTKQTSKKCKFKDAFIGVINFSSGSVGMYILNDFWEYLNGIEQKEIIQEELKFIEFGSDNIIKFLNSECLKDVL